MDLGAGWVPHQYSWGSIRAQDIVNFWVLDRKSAAETARLTTTKNLTGLYVFRTRDGTLGLFELLGESTQPRAVKLRYKVLQARPQALRPL